MKKYNVWVYYHAAYGRGDIHTKELWIGYTRFAGNGSVGIYAVEAETRQKAIIKAIQAAKAGVRP